MSAGMEKIKVSFHFASETAALLFPLCHVTGCKRVRCVPE